MEHGGSDKRNEGVPDRTHLLHRAVLATSDGVVVTDPNLPDNPIVYVNPTFERITGYADEEAIGRNCRFLQGPEDANQPGLAEVRAALKDERGCTVVVRNLRKDGTPFWHELRSSPVLNGDGRLENFIGVQTDVTGLRRAEEERERLREREREREREAAALAEERRKVSIELHDRVAHSMAIVRQNLELHEALRERDPEAARAKLERAGEEAKRSLETARDLSMMLRRRPGRLP
jgi:PAS domain S-box-containing protein